MAAKYPRICVKLDPSVLTRPDQVSGKVAWSMRHHSVPEADIEAATGEISAVTDGWNALVRTVQRWVDVKAVASLEAVPATVTLAAAAPAVAEETTMAKKTTKTPAPKTTKTTKTTKPATRLTPDTVIALCREVREVVDANGSVGLQSLWASLTTTAGVKDHAWEITKAELKSAIKAAGRGQGIRLSGTGNGDERKVVLA